MSQRFAILMTSAALFSATPALAADVTDVEAVIVTGSRAANASINGIEIETLRLPQSVRVLDEALITTTGIANLSDLFDYAGGMARQNSFGGAWDAYAIRGFSGDINQGPDLLVNRFTANRGFNARRDVATVELFQVLKGPASALSGKGEPGGSINIVTKAPLKDTHASTELSYGAQNTGRGAIDVGGPLGAGLSARLIGVYQETDGFRDFVGSDRLLVAPSIAWEPTETLRLLYQFEGALVHFTHDRGLVAVAGNGKALPRSRFLGEPNDGKMRQESLQHQASLTLDIAEGIAIEGGVQYREGSFEGQSTHNSLLVGSQLRRQLRVHDYNWDDLSGRLELSANREILGVEHQLRVGADAFAFDQKRVFFRFNPTAANPYLIDIFNPVYGQPKPLATLNQDILEELRGQSIYAQDLVSLGSQITVLLGVRHDWVQQTNTNFRNNSVSKQSPSETSPRAAITWAPNDQVSVFASWGRSFRYNQGSSFSGAAFAPERGEALEAGVKYALLDNALTGTASVFEITKRNILVNDPTNSGFSIPVGEGRSRGFEIDVNYRLDTRTTITAVYAYTDTKIIRDTRAGFVGSGFSNIPKSAAALYANWRSDEELPGSISLGGGVVYVGKRPGDDINSGFKLPEYVTMRLNIAYHLNEKASLHLDVENLFNSYYLESSFSNVWITPGAARSVVGRVRMKF
ncbi:TonB-dependent siderophore receptor [Phenylobacterium sp.]|jgi:iron complex outermembrane receptor protein|uniref:TonB-dependent siderophore receptor n=1 Tax=Phenylobacterium sp. TaxID=1871053 RepID=UPI0037C54339